VFDRGLIVGRGQDDGVAGTEHVDENEPDPARILVVGQCASCGDERKRERAT
jgi:hypothetical protein